MDVLLVGCCGQNRHKTQLDLLCMDNSEIKLNGVYSLLFVWNSLSLTAALHKTANIASCHTHRQGRGPDIYFKSV